jgi:hypothetical protein
MATLKVVNKNIERNNYDYVRAFAEGQSSNATIIDELIKAYVLISQNLGITPVQFIQLVESKGNSIEQAQFLAQQMNSVRPRNAYLGVTFNRLFIFGDPVLTKKPIPPPPPPPPPPVLIGFGSAFGLSFGS